ncbi:MAG: hypothetical protein Q9172_005503 [Xanthocarpia lactea]
MRNDGTFPPLQPSTGTFLHPRVNGALQSRYSAESVPFSATASASGDRRASSNDSRHNECYDNSPTISISDQPRSRHQEHPLRSKDNSPYDPEKAGHARHSPSYGHRPAQTHSTYVSEGEDVIKEHTVWVLVYLSFFSPAVATLVSIYALFTALFLLLFSPITVFVRPRKPLAPQFRMLLAPPIHYQLRFVCSTYGFEANGNIKSDEYHITNMGNPILLTLINILSPLYAAGIAVTAWVAAGFWFTALILGDPDGRDKKDDGRTVVLGVRRLWERWLIRGLR